MGKFWHGWLRVSIGVMNFTANVILFVMYFIVIIPLGLCMQIFFKKYLLGHAHIERANTYWVQKKKVVQDIAWAREQ